MVFKNSSPTKPFIVISFASKSGSMMSSSGSSSSSPSPSSSLSSPLGVRDFPLFGGSDLSSCFWRYSNWRLMSFGSELSAVGAWGKEKIKKIDNIDDYREEKYLKLTDLFLGLVNLK